MAQDQGGSVELSKYLFKLFERLDIACDVSQLSVFGPNHHLTIKKK